MYGPAYGIVRLLFVTSLIVTLVAVAIAATGTIASPPRAKRFYWLAAFSAWVFSFLGGFSLGIYTLVVAIALATLALAHELGLVLEHWHSSIALGIGVASWWLLVTIVDDYWLFYPLFYLLKIVAG